MSFKHSVISVRYIIFCFSYFVWFPFFLSWCNEEVFFNEEKGVNLEILFFIMYYFLLIGQKSNERMNFSYYNWNCLLFVSEQHFLLHYSQMHFIILCTTRTRKYQLHLLIHFVWFICKCSFFFVFPLFRPSFIYTFVFFCSYIMII